MDLRCGEALEQRTRAPKPGEGVLTRQGKLDEAMAHYSEVLWINSIFRTGARRPGALCRPGKASSMKRWAYYSQVLRINPAYAEAYENLGKVLTTQGKPRRRSP